MAGANTSTPYESSQMCHGSFMVDQNFMVNSYNNNFGNRTILAASHQFHIHTYLNTITEILKDQFRVVFEVIDDFRICPTAQFLQTLWQLPVIQRHHWCNIIPVTDQTRNT